MRNYCTLGDKSFVSQILALYESLKKHSSEEFRFSVLTMDRECSSALRRLELPNVGIVPLEWIEERLGLHGVKATRTYQEYCWSLASQFASFLLPGVNEITYLDADIFFFSNPAPVFAEIGSRSIAITPHRFTDRDRKRLEGNGLFNVGFVHFKNTPAGRQCLSEWAANVREWCFNRVEGEHACGDQKYLDAWPDKYRDDLCIISNIGVNLGPWSLGNWPITEGPRVDGTPLVCYHFHETRFHEDGTVFLTGYPLSKDERRLLYDPYVQAVQSMKVCA